MRRHPILSSLLALLGAASLSAAQVPSAMTLPDLFHKAKEQVKLGSYEAALSTLDQIDKASQRPGLEQDRLALAPSLAFYRGVCLAARGQQDDARGEFLLYLATSPNARLDPAMYPKKVISTFETAQKSLKDPGAASEEPKGSGIAAAYKAFTAPTEALHPPADEDWADGPARFLLTSSESDEFRRVTDPIARSEFITKFWKDRDRTPETPENEFRDEFERRVAFADQYFVQGETRGSYTDRGTVFVLLGPPAYSIQNPMKTGDDTADPAALYLYTPGQVQIAAAPGGSRSAQIARIDAVAGVGTSMNQPSQNWKETWRYFRKDLPGRLPYEFVDFSFITKPGYGESVLQRDPPSLQAMEKARASFPKP
ncbi:MAG TPA: GWxTD domain-containing protein [Thermoanaerobaculia bacterium]